jgi:hypothetical protein
MEQFQNEKAIYRICTYETTEHWKTCTITSFILNGSSSGSRWAGMPLVKSFMHITSVIYETTVFLSISIIVYRSIRRIKRRNPETAWLEDVSYQLTGCDAIPYGRILSTFRKYILLKLHTVKAKYLAKRKQQTELALGLQFDGKAATSNPPIAHILPPVPQCKQ